MHSEISCYYESSSCLSLLRKTTPKESLDSRPQFNSIPNQDFIIRVDQIHLFLQFVFEQSENQCKLF